jgi:hypothetical protein
MPWLAPHLSFAPAALLTVIGVLGAGLLVGALNSADRRRALHRGRIASVEGTRIGESGVRLLLHLTPVLLLSLVYPVASRQMLGIEVEGVPLTALILGASVAMPWISQGVSMPLYSALGALLLGDDTDAVKSRFGKVWGSVGVQTAPTVLLFAVPIHFAAGWGWHATGVFVLLSLANTLFAQALVLSSVAGGRAAWALSWVFFAAAVWFSPTTWWLPPLVGSLPALVLLRRQLWQRPVWVSPIEVWRDTVRGLLLGSVLWADKLVLFMVVGTAFAVDTLFLALLPAIVAYNFYFVCLAPRFDASVASMRHAMENRPLRELGPYSRGLAVTVSQSVLQAGLVGAVMAFGMSWLLVDARPDQAAFAVAVALASWTFMLVTVTCYKIDYVGQRGRAQWLSLVMVGALVAAFLILPAGPLAYLAAAGAALVVLAVAVWTAVGAWRTPEYTFFWRHATAW